MKNLISTSILYYPKWIICYNNILYFFCITSHWDDKQIQGLILYIVFSIHIGFNPSFTNIQNILKCYERDLDAVFLWLFNLVHSQTSYFFKLLVICHPNVCFKEAHLLYN